MVIEADPGMTPGQDAGEVENRLSLNPTDERWSSELLGWEDGVEYVLTNVRVIQVSPGEFEVVSLEINGANPAPNANSVIAPEPQSASAKASLDTKGRPHAALQGRLGMNR